MIEKLTRTNHPLWKGQVVSALRVVQLAGYINASAQPPTPFLDPPKGDDKKDVMPTPNPEYDPWIAKDQHVLNYLLSSLSREILSQISSTQAAAAAWAAIEGMLSHPVF
jgi:VanZ family protein